MSSKYDKNLRKTGTIALGGGGPGKCNPFIWIHSLKLPSFPRGSSQTTWYRNKPNRCLLIKRDERKRSFALWPWEKCWLRRGNEEMFNRALLSQRVHAHLLFSFAAISPVSLVHTCWGCSVSCKHTNTNVQKLVTLQTDSPPVAPLTLSTSRVRCLREERMKQDDTAQWKRRTEGSSGCTQAG